MTMRPIVIAHRGASGYLPEHTLASKALAYGLGADFIEQDVVATRDGELVVLHDLHLDDVTDVAHRFPGRQREDGRHYVVDFDLVELRELFICERRAAGSAAARYPQRFPSSTSLFGIVTLEEELALIQGLNRSMRRSVGIYPEIKHPNWHRAHGIDLAGKLLATLRSFGYSSEHDAAFVQCFDTRELERVRQELGSELRLVQLVGAEAEYQPLLTASGLRALTRYACALGTHYSQLVDVPRTGKPRSTELARMARGAGLELHPYTFRADDLPAYARTLEELIELFVVETPVDGLFCDHPDVAVRVLEKRSKVQ